MEITQNEMDKYTRNAVDSLIQKFFSKGVLSRTGESLIASIYALNSNAHKGILSVLSEQIVDFPEEFSNIDIELLYDNFEYVIKKCYNYSAWYTHDVTPTKDLLSLISRVAKIKSTDTILLPKDAFKFALDNPDANYAVCTSLEGVALIDIVSEVCHINTRSDTTDLTEFFEDSDYKEAFNHIISFPSIHDEPKTVISHIINCIENGLAKGGSLSIILPTTICSSDRYKRLREYLIENQNRFRTGIITLPLSFDRQDIILLVIEKTESIGSIYIADLGHKEFKVVDEIGVTSLKINSMIETIEKGDGNYCRLIKIHDLVDGNKFTPSYYFIDRAFNGLSIVEKEQLVPLKELITIIPENYDYDLESVQGLDVSMKFISSSNLSENYLDCTINLDELCESRDEFIATTLANGGYCAWENDRMLVANIQNANDDYQIGISTRILHFCINSEKLSMDYLLKELTSHYVREQARILLGIIPFSKFSIGEFLSIKVIVPAFETQNQLLLDETKKGYADKTEELEKAFNEFKEDMHNKKHGIGQTIFAINNWMKLLKIARKRGEGVVKDTDIIGKNHPWSVLEIYENLEATMKRLQIQISKMDTGYELIPTQIGISGYIMDFISSHPRSEFSYINHVNWRAEADIPVIKTDDNNNIIGISTTEFVLKKGDELFHINFPTEALEIIFENIIANACAHGFVDKDKSYNIKIAGEVNGKHLSLYISNNGAPLHKDFAANDVFKYAKSTSDAISGHHGTGGYEVWKLMKQFGGSSEFISTPDEEYTITYKLTFPIANIINVL